MRYIDADTLLKELWHIRWNLQMIDDTHTADKMMAGLRKAEEKIETAPTIDAVEVVRCQNCKHGFFAGTALFCDMPSRRYALHKAAINWFCADGKRREDDGTRDI